MALGVVRPEGIDSDNTISHEEIAEPRMAYGGRGTLSGPQAPRWGVQVWGISFPFWPRLRLPVPGFRCSLGPGKTQGQRKKLHWSLF